MTNMLSFSTIVVQSLLLAVLVRCIYLRYFHPLSNYPGPALAAVTNLWFVIISRLTLQLGI